LYKKFQKGEITMTTVTYSIPNISCHHCTHTIQSEVSDIPGVQSVSAGVDTKQATITFDEPATEAEIKALLAEINYPVVEG
jgi:copper chaperone CopZ